MHLLSNLIDLSPSFLVFFPSISQDWWTHRQVLVLQFLTISPSISPSTLGCVASSTHTATLVGGQIVYIS